MTLLTLLLAPANEFVGVAVDCSSLIGELAEFIEIESATIIDVESLDQRSQVLF